MRNDKDKAEDHAQEARPAGLHDGTARERVAGRPPRSHAVDVRHHRPGISDRQDSHRLAASRPRSFALYYPFLDVREGHHGASHDDLSDGYERISRFHLSQLAYLAGKLDAMPEGEGTVLDNCCLLWLSNMWAGWKHDNMKVPVVLAGGLGWHARNGPNVGLLIRRRRQPQVVQPVFVHHGPDGSEARSLRRRGSTPGSIVRLLAEHPGTVPRQTGT